MLKGLPPLGLLSVNIAGGGSKNCVSCGQIQYLEENKYKPDMVFAASGGGLSAAMWAQGDLDALHEIWLNISNKDVRTFNPLLMFGSRACVYDYSPLWTTLKKYITRERLAKSPFDLWLTVTSLKTKSAERFNLRDLPSDIDPIELLVASASISGFVQPVRDEWIDGGTTDDYSLEAACNARASRIIVLHPSHPANTLKIKNFLDAVEIGIGLQMWSNYQRQLDAVAMLPPNLQPEVIQIMPGNPPPISVFDFSYKGLDRSALITLGYMSAKEALMAPGQNPFELKDTDS